jgi:hypothetical protein
MNVVMIFDSGCIAEGSALDRALERAERRAAHVLDDAAIRFYREIGIWPDTEPAAP